MDPREYDWQLGELAALSPDFGPDERGFQPPPPQKAWAVPTTGMAPWPYMERPAQTDADYAQQAREAAAYRTRNPYQTAATRPPESNRLTQVAGAIGNMPAAMGELAAIPAHTMAENPYPPGSEEADFYERARKSNTYAKAPEAALSLMGTGASFAQPGAAGMLGGKLSRTADLDKLRKAEEMLKYNKTSEQILKETGWFPTAGNILKYEISDKGSGWAPGFDPSKIPKSELPVVARTGAAYLHPRGYEAYPQLAQGNLYIRDMGPGNLGGLRPRTYENDPLQVFLAPGSSGQMRRVLGHELLGHGVQDLERSTWSTGGSPDKIYKEMKEGTPAWDEYQRIRSQIAAPMTRDEYMNMAMDAGVTDANYEKYVEGHLKSFKLPQSSEEQLKKLAAQNIYEKIAGEEEARAIALRMNLSDKSLREKPFEQSMQTPFSQQGFAWQPPLIPGSRPKPPTVYMPEPPAPTGMHAMGDLADQSLIMSQQQPKGFVPGKILEPETTEYANPRLRAKAQALFGKYPQYAEQYPSIGPPELVTRVPDPKNPGKFKAGEVVPYKTMKEALAKDATPDFMLEKKLTPEARQFQKDRQTILDDMDLHGYEPYFDPAKRFDVNPKHYGPFEDTAVAASPKTVKTYDEWYEQYGKPEARARLQAGYERGQLTPEAEGWYLMGQLEQKYVKELGAKEGRDRFKREFADMMAATTGGASPYNNWLMAHYAGFMAKRGERMPERSFNLPFPIGGRYAAGNIEQAQKYIDEGMKGFSAEKNPKRYDFSSAFQGNRNAFTMDEQMMQAIEPGTNIPQWYGPATRVGREEAQAAGVDPRGFQDVGWAGLKGLKTEAKGKKFEYEGPMIGQINRSIEVTHRLTGMPREEIVRRGVIRKEIPMYTVGGGILGGLAAQDQYGKPMGNVEADEIPSGFASSKGETRERHQREYERQQREFDRRNRQYR